MSTILPIYYTLKICFFQIKYPLTGDIILAAGYCAGGGVGAGASAEPSGAISMTLFVLGL
jgi:hypothetical protein